MFATIASLRVEPATAPISEEERDAQLVAQVARWRDREAFDSLYARHINAVLKSAMHVCANRAAAQDIAQHTFLALWERADHLADKQVRVRPWLTTVARNAAIDAWRRLRDANSVPLDEVPELRETSGGPEEFVLDRESSAQLHQALSTLSAKQRQAVYLIYFRKLTYREAASVSGLAPGTLKSRIRLALANLRRTMGA
jgi:RNA polymerase sigma-70 factor, ECF subfamily